MNIKYEIGREENEERMAFTFFLFYKIYYKTQKVLKSFWMMLYYYNSNFSSQFT